MQVKCPVCQTEYICSAGKYQCQCGIKFFVDNSGNVRAEDNGLNVAPHRYQTNHAVNDDLTMPGKRDRKPDCRFAAGDLIMNRYKVLAELGQGGMGVVYKCFDEIGGIEVALKALPPELSHNTLEMEDIKDNFQLVSKLVHQNIAISKNLEKDDSNGNYYLIMECVAGEDLRRWLRRKRLEGKLALDDVLPIIRQTADALDYAHKQMIIHRDIKPGNIMISTDGTIKVLDFGLAAQIHTSMTRVSMAYHGTSGTGPYMAPEQWEGRPQDARADQYALAVMIYEMLAGHLPFESSDAAVLREAVLKSSAPVLANVPKSVNSAIQRAMSKNPAERFENCSSFAAALSGQKVNTSAILDREALLQKLRKIPTGWIVKLNRKAVWIVAAAIIVTGIAGYFCKDIKIVKNLTSRVTSLNTFTVELPHNGIKLEMIKIPAGTFFMGSPSFERGRDYDEQRHKVTLTQDYYIGKFEVTQEQYLAVMNKNPSERKGKNHPVEYIDWEDAREFCNILNEFYAIRLPGKLPEGYKFDLPTEAQWEYACRAGTITALNNGKDLTYTDICSNLDEVAWYEGNSVVTDEDNRKKNIGHREVGKKRPNAWGLYDMHGNVAEWCRDYRDYSNCDVIDPMGEVGGRNNMIRGGSYCHSASNCRSARRFRDSRDSYVGFRLALVPVRKVKNANAKN